MKNKLKDELIVFIGSIKMLLVSISLILYAPINVLLVLLNYLGHYVTAKTALKYIFMTNLKLWSKETKDINYDVLCRNIKHTYKHYGIIISKYSKQIIYNYYTKSWHSLNREGK